MNTLNKNKIKNALIACCGRCKKTMVAGFVMAIAAALIAFSLLPLAVQAVSPNMVEVLVKVNREVLKTPDLYEHLTINLKTADNAAGMGAVEVLNIKMSLIGSEPISIGKYSGPNLYVIYKVTFDGPESTNEYQGSAVSTSYEFFSKSDKKLNVFKILSQEGDVFKNMTNLNPGDIKEGIVHIDPLSFTLSTEMEETKTTEETTKPLPQTDDPAPIKPLVYVSVGLAALLCVQIVIYVKRKRKDKTGEIGI